MSRQWQDWTAGVLLLIAVLLLFVPALRYPNALLYPTFSPHSDVTVIHWPKAQLMASVWQATRTLPLWTPTNLSGMPLAANQLAMLFYPPAWLGLFLPINLVFNWLFIFHLFWAGLGVYWLLRAGFELDVIPALAGALTFSLGGKLLAHVAGGHVSLVGAMAWMPWAFLGLHQVLRADEERHENRLHGAMLAAVALVMQICTHTLITLYTAYLLAAYAIWQIISNLPSPPALARKGTDRPRWKGGSIFTRHSLYLPLLAIPALVALLGAAQWLPLLELTGYSNRALSLEQASEFGLTPLMLLIGLFLPSSQAGHEMVVYLGLVPLILAPLGLSRMDRRGWFWAGVVILGTIFALGTATPLFELAYRWLPGFGWVRTPARIFLLVSLAVAIMTGLGMQRLVMGYVRWSTPVTLSIGMFTLASGLGLAILFGQASRATLGLAFLPAFTFLVMGLIIRSKLPLCVGLSGLILILFADLASFDLTLIRFVSPAQAFGEGEAVAEYLAARSGLFRTYSPSYSLPAHVAARAGLQTADGVEPVHLAAYDRFMALAGGYGDSSFSVAIPPFPPDHPLKEAFRNTQPDLHLLGLLNVEYVVADFAMDWPGLTLIGEMDGKYVYRNQHALPRAWIVYSNGTSLQTTWFTPRGPTGPDGDARDDWPTQLTTLANQSARSVATGEALAEVTHYAPNRIEVKTQSAHDGMLILSEIWYPGWQATVDGEPSPVQPVAGILRGVELDRGHHSIVLMYDPASVRWGVRLSLVGIAILLAWSGFRVWQRWHTRSTKEK